MPYWKPSIPLALTRCHCQTCGRSAGYVCGYQWEERALIKGVLCCPKCESSTLKADPKMKEEEHEDG